MLSLGLGVSDYPIIRGAGGGVVDEHFDNVVLLYDMAGSDAATNITDLSNSAHEETWFATAQLDTAQKKFGSASLLLDGNSDYITVPDHDDFNLAVLASDQFTIECHIRPANVSGSKWFWVKYDTNNQRSFIFNLTGAALQFISYTLGSSSPTTTVSGGTAVANTWHHAACSQDATTRRLFLDGVQVDSEAGTSIHPGTKNLDIGGLGVGGAWMNGHMTNLRLTKGVARYTENFTPPDAEYPTS